MNSKQSRVLSQKHTKFDYETRFLLQSKNSSPNRRSPEQARLATQLKSRALRLLGGEEVLDFVCICFAERIADDDVLAEVYGDLNSKALVQLQKELLLLALDDGFSDLTMGTKQNVYTQGILQRHVRLGLMEREVYFRRLSHHLDDALTACEISDLKAAVRTQRRFDATQPLLQVTEEYLQSQSEKMKSIRLPFFGKKSSA